MGSRIACVVVALGMGLAGCGDPASELDSGTDGGGVRDAGGAIDAGLDAQVAVDAAVADDASTDAGVDSGAPPADAGVDTGAADGGPPDGGPADAGMRVLDVRVLADPACSELSFDPPSIGVPAGTSFTVHWINATACTAIDIDKGGTVPIVIGLEPGASYHDTVREWCGTLFTGTFYFRAYYAPSFPSYLDVDCSI